MQPLSAELRRRTWGTNREHERIRPGDWRFAETVLHDEMEIVAAADGRSRTHDEFEHELDEVARTYDWCEFDVGVAGLVYALNAAGFATDISCRSHPRDPWAEYPMVVTTCDDTRFALLVEAANRSGVGIDDYAEGGVCLYAASITSMMALAQSILDAHAVFIALPETIPWRADLDDLDGEDPY